MYEFKAIPKSCDLDRAFDLAELYGVYASTADYIQGVGYRMIFKHHDKPYLKEFGQLVTGGMYDDIEIY